MSRVFDPTRNYATLGESPHTVGQVEFDHRGFCWQFVHARELLEVTRVVTINPNGQTHLCINDNADYGHQAAVVIHAIPDEYYGWVCIKGDGDVLTHTVSENSTLYTDSTGGGTQNGRLNNAASNNSQIFGLGTTAGRTNSGPVHATWIFPWWGA